MTAWIKHYTEVFLKDTNRVLYLVFLTLKSADLGESFVEDLLAIAAGVPALFLN